MLNSNIWVTLSKVITRSKELVLLYIAFIFCGTLIGAVVIFNFESFAFLFYVFTTIEYWLLSAGIIAALYALSETLDQKKSMKKRDDD